ncbi:MAG TPA: hypothetical protein DHW02_17275 [Ktedonobacter sp.]|nr:hypothetical protein [Ktedonobacter sp.]
MSNKITYRQQFTRCGKERCRKCREGEGHGPYWYAYWSEKGRTVSKYIGVHLPTNAEIEVNQQVQEIAAASNSKAEPAYNTLFAETPSSPTSHSSSPELRVYLLGQFHVERKSEQGWSIIDHRTWQRRRARSLLGCLLNSPGRRLGREQAMELLWPDLEVDISTNRLNGAVHELRQILEPHLERPAASRLLRLEHDVLELADNAYIWVDVDAFEQLLKEAEVLCATQPVQAEYLFEEAVSLYSGGYLLEELYAEWAAPRRDALQRRWVGTLLDLAHMRTQRGAFASAIETLDRLRVADPTNETALQRLMVLLTHTDRRGEALHIYRQHAITLQREYEGVPLTETRQLYEALQAGESSEVYLSRWVQSRPKAQEQPSLRAKISHASPPAIHTSQVSARLAFQSGRHNQSPLVGRDKERHLMQTVLRALEQQGTQKSNGIINIPQSEQSEQQEQQTIIDSIPLTGPKRPHLLLLMGEPGLGKTRLAEELSSDAHERAWTVIWSRVHEQDGNIPYHPWRSILRSLLTDIAGIADTKRSPGEMFVTPGLPAFQLEWLRPLLPELGSTPTPEHSIQSYEQERLHLWEATLGLLSMLSTQQPLLIVVDDLHWADESSIELLTYLAHHLQNQHILLVGTCRDDELAPSHKLRSLVSALRREQAVVTLAVQPLTNAQIATLVAHLPQDLVAQIQTQAAGNPLFAEELARYAASQNIEASGTSVELRENASSFMSQPSTTLHTVGYDTPSPLSPLPEIVTALLERRLHRLSVECQSLLGKAAVLGGSFELRQLLYMASEHSEDIALNLLEEALQEGLLIEEGTGSQITYHFWHPLIVSHLYERLSAARRAQMHRRAVGAIEATSTPLSREKVASTIVYHLLRGGSDAQQIVDYAEMAGHQARVLIAYAEAHYYYLKAIQAFISLLPSSGATDNDDVVTSLEHIEASLSKLAASYANKNNDLLRLCRLLEHTAECKRILGFFEDERRLYECILAIRTSVVFQQQLASLQMKSTSNEEVVLHYEAQFQALLWREMSATWVAVGDYDQAYVCCERGRAIMQQAGVSKGTAWAAVCLQIGVILRYKGNYHEARMYVHEALNILHHTHMSSETQVGKQFLASSPQTRIERALSDDPSYIGHAQAILGIIEASEGHISDALTHMLTALHFYEQQELVSEIILVCGNIGAAYIMRGDHDAARTFLYRALDLAERVGDIPNLAFITGNLGDVAYRSGNLLEAEEWYARSLSLAERVHDREHISWCCVVLANVQQDQGKLHEAAKNIYRAISTGRAIKNARCIRFALVSLGDLRIVEAIVLHEQQRAQEADHKHYQHIEQVFHRLLRRAKSTLQRAISQEEVEKESIIDCKLLLATVYYLLGQFQRAQHMALQTLHEAQAQETSRAIGRTQRLLGRIFAAQHRYDEADHFFEQATELFHKQGLRLDYARTLYGYGYTLLKRSSLPTYIDEQQELYQSGLHYVHVAHGFFADAHAMIDLAEAERLIARYEMREREGVY